MKIYLETPDIAERLGVSVEQARNLVKQGVFPNAEFKGDYDNNPLGGHWLVPLEDIEQYKASQQGRGGKALRVERMALLEEWGLTVEEAIPLIQECVTIPENAEALITYITGENMLAKAREMGISKWRVYQRKATAAEEVASALAAQRGTEDVREARRKAKRAANHRRAKLLEKWGMNKEEAIAFIREHITKPEDVEALTAYISGEYLTKLAIDNVYYHRDRAANRITRLLSQRGMEGVRAE